MLEVNFELKPSLCCVVFVRFERWLSDFGLPVANLVSNMRMVFVDVFRDVAGNTARRVCASSKL